jgi:hypothetical protein
VGVTGSGGGWRCHRCQAGGDGADLVAWAVLGVDRREATAEQADEARAWAVERGLVAPDPASSVSARSVAYVPPAPRVEAPPRYPSQEMIVEARQYFARIPELNWPWWVGRGYGCPRDARACLRVHGGSQLFDRIPAAYQLVLPLCDHTGTTRSYHLRRTDGGTPKTRNPTGYSVAGLAFLSRTAYLATVGEMPDAIIVEGVTDYLYACSIVPDDVAVIGGISGSWPILSRLRWRPDARVIVATDADPPYHAIKGDPTSPLLTGAGDLYAQAIAGELARSPSPPAAVVRVRPPEGSDLDAWRPSWSSLARDIS